MKTAFIEINLRDKYRKRLNTHYQKYTSFRFVIYFIFLNLNEKKPLAKNKKWKVRLPLSKMKNTSNFDSRSDKIGSKEFDKFLSDALHKSRNRIYKKQCYSKKTGKKKL